MAGWWRRRRARANGGASYGSANGTAQGPAPARERLDAEAPVEDGRSSVAASATSARNADESGDRPAREPTGAGALQGAEAPSALAQSEAPRGEAPAALPQSESSSRSEPRSEAESKPPAGGGEGPASPSSAADDSEVTDDSEPAVPGVASPRGLEAPAVATPGPEPPPNRSSDPDDGPSGAGIAADLGDTVQSLLEAAETAAAAIRREAGLDAERITEERRRYARARGESRHLLRLADSLSLQAEMVQRQCVALEALLEPFDDELSDSIDSPLDDSPAIKAEAAARARNLRDERRGRSGFSREREEAHRMKLAGAGRTEVETYLRQAGASDPARVADEVFAPPRPGG